MENKEEEKPKTLTKIFVEILFCVIGLAFFGLVGNWVVQEKKNEKTPEQIRDERIYQKLDSILVYEKHIQDSLLPINYYLVAQYDSLTKAKDHRVPKYLPNFE